MAYGDSSEASLAAVRSWIASSSGVEEYWINGRKVRRSIKDLRQMEVELQWEVARGSSGVLVPFQIDNPGPGV